MFWWSSAGLTVNITNWVSSPWALRWPWTGRPAASPGRRWSPGSWWSHRCSTGPPPAGRRCRDTNPESKTRFCSELGRVGCTDGALLSWSNRTLLHRGPGETWSGSVSAFVFRRVFICFFITTETFSCHESSSFFFFRRFLNVPDFVLLLWNWVKACLFFLSKIQEMFVSRGENFSSDLYFSSMWDWVKSTFFNDWTFFSHFISPAELFFKYVKLSEECF